MATGRPAQFDREVVLDAATTAFWAKGYEATSMQDLLAATRLSKSSLYQAFGGKPQLFEQCLARYGDRLAQHLGARLESNNSAFDFLRGLLAEIASEGRVTRVPRGCLIINTASEFGQREPRFARRVEAGVGGIRAVLERAIARAQQEGDVTRARPARLLADYVFSSIAGLRTLVKSGAGQKALLGIVDLTLASLKSGDPGATRGGARRKSRALASERSPTGRDAELSLRARRARSGRVRAGA